jgi:cyclopropane-fatty-acyl-phospholipid synthase
MTTEASTYIGASSDAIQMHYDVGNAFWSLWLDPLMVYSGALWEPGDTLADAQARKLDYYLNGTNAANARRVLDVGCGWGGLLRRLTENHGLQDVTGLTLSEAQADWIRGFDNPAIDVRVENWSDHEPDEPYDTIISLGAFEHFARYDSKREEKLDQYRRFFAFCHRNLQRGGRLGLQTISKGSAAVTRQGLDDAHFIWKYIFPESDVPWPADVMRACEKRFEITSMRNDAEHYVRTGAAWEERLHSRREEAVELVGEETYAMYDHYFGALKRQFETGQLGLLRVLMRRV